MGYEYQNKKAPLASLEEDFEEINDNDTGMDYEPAFFAQASGSGAEPNLDGLQQRLLAGYKADKSDELQEFRKHGYNIDELRVDKALLEDFIQELDGLPEFSDWSITSTANALMSMIESVEKMDVKALNGEQKKVMRRVIDLSRQATDVVMMAALHLPLGGALLAAREDRAALGDDAPTEEDIAEVTANLKTTRGTIKQVRLAALDLDLRIPDKEMPWPTFKEDVDRLYRSLNRLGEGKVKTVKKTLKPDKSLTEKVQAIPLRVVDMAKAAGTDTVKGLKKLPTNKEEWKGTIRQVGKLSKQAGTSIWNKGKTVRPSLNSLTARMGWAVKNTNSQALYGTQEKFLQASDEETEFRESLKLLVEQIHFAMSAYLKYSQALAATPQEEVEQRVALRQQRQAAIDKVELLEKMLEEKEAGILKEEYPGQAEKVVPFLEGMKKEMDVFWQAAAQLDSLLGSLISPAPEEEEPLFPGNKQGELIAALGKVTSAQNRLKQRVMKATLKPFDELSVDWRIARDIGRYFYARREALLGNNTPASMAQFDAAVEEVIWTQVAGDFRKTRSPRGKQMAVRASWAYREAIAGTLQHSKTVQEIVDEQDNVDTQLIKLGQKSLVGRAAFAGVSGNVGRLIAAKPRNVLIPNLGVVKVLLSPISFWNDYRKLSRAVEPGEAFSWGSYRKMAQRNAFRQAFRMLKFALPRVATTGISGVLALWALYRAGIGDTFKKALTEGITVMPVAGGLVGANKLANSGLGRGAQPLTTTDDSTQMEREKVRVKRDAQPASQIVEQISEKSAKIEQLQQEVKSLEEKIQGIMRVRILYRKEESLAEARSHHDAKSREIDQLRKEISILEQPEGAALKRKMQSLAQLNQPVINPQQRINERVAEMIEEYNRKHSDSKPLTPNTPVIVILEPYKTLHSQSGTTDITRSFAETFTLQEITTGEYLYKLNEITKHNLSNYQITFNKHNDYIASVDRNALESGLRKEVDDYFSDPTKANEFSGALESVIKHRVIAYLDEHCKDDIFRQRLVDFYEGKAAADEVFINDKKVPGVLAFKIGEGVNAQTLVMSIYTKDSFVFKTKEVSILRHHPKGSYSVPVKIEALEPSSDQKVFDRVISNALSFYEQLRYIGKANPFEYKKINNFEISAPISFGHGEKIGCLPEKMMRDIQEKTKENYDTSIYTKSEEKKDVILATFRKVASAASVSLTLIPGPKSAVARTVLFFVSLGIDALSTVGAYVQAEQADRPEKHDSLMRDAIYETILFGLGNVGDSAEAALKGYRAIKSKNIMNILKKVDVVDDVTDVTVESATASLRIFDKTKTAPTLYAQASQVTGTVAEKNNASDERKDISFDLDSNTMIIRFDGGDNNRKSMTDAEMVRYISRALEDRGLERGIIKSISIQSDYPIMVNESYGGQIVANQLGIPLILWQPSPTKEGAYMQKVFEPS